MIAPARRPRRGVVEVGEGALESSRTRGAAAAARPARRCAARPRCTCAHQSSSLLSRPAWLWPSATMHGAGQRREVDEPLGALGDRVGDAVGEHEPALGVGVVDLDRLTPASVRTMSPGLTERPLGMFSVAPTTPITRTGSAEPGDRARSPRCTAAPPDMSYFISSMCVARLERDAAAVERHRLADEARASGRCAPGPRSAA